MKARIKFQKLGEMRFIGHLDLMRYFQKVIRRADLPIRYSEGMSPHMIMSFALPLGIGLTSEGEYVDIELTEDVEKEDLLLRLNTFSVDDIRFTDALLRSDGEKTEKAMAEVAAASYVISLKSGNMTCMELTEKLEAFMASDTIGIVRKNKKAAKKAALKARRSHGGSPVEDDFTSIVNIRPLICDLKASEEGICLLAACSSQANLRPDELAGAFYRFCGYDGVPSISVRRTEPNKKRDLDGTITFIPLIQAD